MRELGDRHAFDGDDSGADAVPERAGDARRACYEVVHDEAARKASALEYRQRVEAAYAAHDAGDAESQEARASHVPADSATGADAGTASRGDASGSRHPGRSGPAGRTRDAGGDEYATHGRRGPAGEADGRGTGPDQGIEGTVKPDSTAGGPRGNDLADQASVPGSEYANQNGSHGTGDGKHRRDYGSGEAAAGAEPAEQLAEPTADGGRGGGGKDGPGEGPGAPAGEGPGAQPPGRDNGGSGDDKADRPGQASRDTSPPSPAGQDTPESEALSRGAEDSWPPLEADRDRVRALYREYLADMASAGRQSHRDLGTNTVGPRPDQSPGEISGLPPPGDELTEIESSKKSRFSELFGEAEKEENLDGLHDAAEEYAGTVQRWLSARPPEGHAEQHVPAHHPYVTPWAPEHGIEGGDAAGAVLMAGILTVHMARWIDDKLRHGKGDHDDGNR